VARNRIKIAKVAGIPVQVDVSWLLIFVWVTWSLGASYYPERYPSWMTGATWALSIVTSLLFFGSVLLHELGHAYVAKTLGTPVKDITLFIFGGVATMAEEPDEPGKELAMAIAGPLVSLALSAVFAAVHLATRASGSPVSGMCLFLGGINLSLGAFNLLPGFPLDGGRVLRALLWGIRKDLAWATRWASRVGQFFAYGMILLGISWVFSGQWVNGLWLAFIGLFIDGAARTSYRQMSLREQLEGQTVAQAMNHACMLLAPDMHLDEIVDKHLLPGGRRCFAVGDQNGVLGLLTIHNLAAVPKVDWPFTEVSEVVTPFEDLIVVTPETTLWGAVQQMTREGVNQLPVVVDEVLDGMISREDVVSYIKVRAELQL